MTLSSVKMPNNSRLAPVDPDMVRNPCRKPSQAMVDIRVGQSDQFFRLGRPILSAVCHLSVEDVDGALHKLWMGNELELAMALRLALGLTHDENLSYHLARKCEANGMFNIGTIRCKLYVWCTTFNNISC